MFLFRLKIKEKSIGYIFGCTKFPSLTLHNIKIHRDTERHKGNPEISKAESPQEGRKFNNKFKEGIFGHPIAIEFPNLFTTISKPTNPSSENKQLKKKNKKRLLGYHYKVKFLISMKFPCQNFNITSKLFNIHHISY